jgi:N-methylhydantoinase B/oxoprolinase/acetone carboxylase alpha subunit
VILNRFSLAPGSGGQGKFRGGEGVLRKTIHASYQPVICFLNRKKFSFYLCAFYKAT